MTPLARTLLVSALLLTSVAAAPASAGKLPPASETLFMMNGDFWTGASPDERTFYVRVAIETLAALPAREEGVSRVGGTPASVANWITAFYSANRQLHRLPVSVAFRYAMRAANGEPWNGLVREGADTLKRIVDAENSRSGD